jgi:TPR repeat protein
MYRNGWGVDQNFTESARLYREAADLGDTYSFQVLGRMSADGRGVPQDVGQARRLIARAAQLGDSDASVLLDHI